MSPAPALPPVRRPAARRRLDVLLAGGGTVGHLAPGFAIAEALAARGLRSGFVTPGASEERTWFPADLGRPERLPAPRAPRGVREVPWFGPRLGAAVARAGGLIRRLRPRVVVGLGGWPCVPPVLAARAAGLPVALVASDASAGRAVRLLARLARRVYLACPSAAAGLGPADRLLVTGPALRRAVLEAQADPGRFGLAADRPVLLVVGGSLGARGLNQAVVRGLEAAVRGDPAWRDRVQVLHAVGRSGDGVAEAYARLGLCHHVTPFLVEMGVAWRTATLAVTRAGALTCAELRGTGTPAVLVPYPHHADRQQFGNARPLVDAGGALLLEEGALTPERFRLDVLDLLVDAGRLEGMRRALAGPGAGGADQIADDLVRLLGRGTEGAPPA